MPTKPDNEILAAAIEGFEAQKKRIDAQIAEIRQQLAGGSSPAATPEPGGTRRKVSAAGRKRMAEAQRKRWSVKKQSGSAPKAAMPAQKPKRKLSAAGRKNIIEATKKRWASIREAAAKSAK